MCIFEYIFDNCSCSSEDNLCHHMPIKHIISMFEQKIAKIFEEILLLKGNIPNLLH